MPVKRDGGDSLHQDKSLSSRVTFTQNLFPRLAVCFVEKRCDGYKVLLRAASEQRAWYS